MKKNYILIITLIFSGCASTEIQTVDGSDSYVVSDPTVISDNHLACRAKSDDQVEHIYNKITTGDKQSGAILYFHGGLSSQDYMKDELGPMLLGSLFKQSNMSDYYPVFINYDASLFQRDNLLEISRITKSDNFQHGLDKFKRKLPEDMVALNKASKEDKTSYDKNLTNISMSYLDQAISSTKREKGFQSKSFNEKQNDYFLILKDDAFAETIGNYLIQSDVEFKEVAEDIEGAIIEEKGVESTKGLFSISKLGIGIARSLARFAVGNHHQIVPTFEEEFFRVFEYYGISIKNIAAAHWVTVKKHSEQCFEEGSAGLKLITKLIEYQQDNHEFSIHTISHSAGAIPTGQLLKALGSRKQKISSVNLIVPAINQSDFKRLIISNINATEKLNSYVLKQYEEEIDSIAFGAYPASLLFFVSGVAENSWYSDKMLMIDQHLAPNGRAYSNKWYLSIVKEKPKPIWEFVKNNPDSWYYYPGNISYEESDYSKRASHECTKYPWISAEVGKNIIYQITNVAVDSIPVPILPIDKVKNANEKCR